MVDLGVEISSQFLNYSKFSTSFPRLGLSLQFAVAKYLMFFENDVYLGAGFAKIDVRGVGIVLKKEGISV